MAEQQKVFKLGSSSVLVDSDEFEEGYLNGYIAHPTNEYPLTVEQIRRLITESLADTCETADCNTGYIVGALQGIYKGHPSQYWDTEPGATSIRLGDMTLYLNRRIFREGYYFGQQEAYEADYTERPALRTVTAIELLRYFAHYDPKTHRYYFTDEEMPFLEMRLGQLVGYLLASLFPQSTEMHDTEPVPVLQEA